MKTRFTIATTLVVLAIVGLAGLTQAAPYTWTGGTVGEWTNEANWGDGVSGYPNAAGAYADFVTLNPSGKKDVTVASPVTVGYIEGSGAHWNTRLLNTLTGTGTGSITLDNNGAGATLDWYWAGMNQAGNHTVSAPLIMADNVKLQTLMGNAPFYLNSKISEIGDPRKLTIESQMRDAWPTVYGRTEIGGTEANTYSGGTDIKSLGGNSLLRLTKDGALGTGDVWTTNSTQNGYLQITYSGGTEDRIDDSASLYLGTRIKIVLDEGVNETVGGLYFGDVKQDYGTWGSTSSAAQYQNDTYFASGHTGILTVVPEPSALVLLLAGALGLLLVRRRK